MEDQIKVTKFAVLIDGDNAQCSLLAQVFAEVSKVGFITVKRIYGDWTTTNMNGWKEYLHKHAVQPVQQFRYTVGKNATDSAMIIDAMDLLHSKHVDGFCIVSSDSDYTRLATRIRENGLYVVGVGEKKTPESFVNACDQFIYCENLIEQRIPLKKVKPLEKADSNADNNDPLPLLIQGFELAAKEAEWVQLATMGSFLRQINSAFDPRTYGYKRLQQLIKQYSETFALKYEKTKTPPVIWVGLISDKSISHQTQAI